jgi:hypothetical protein
MPARIQQREEQRGRTKRKNKGNKETRKQGNKDTRKQQFNNDNNTTCQMCFPQ